MVTKPEVMRFDLLTFCGLAIIALLFWEFARNMTLGVAQIVATSEEVSVADKQVFLSERGDTILIKRSIVSQDSSNVWRVSGDRFTKDTTVFVGVPGQGGFFIEHRLAVVMRTNMDD